jgi:thymidylate synthase (FAD)
MGKVIINEETTKEPIQLIGQMAGECWGAATDNKAKNFKRGISCLNSEHGRTWEFPEVYMTLDGYSARVIREWYTHIGGSPSRLQASTRYIDYKNFEYVIPPKIEKNKQLKEIYDGAMWVLSGLVQALDDRGVAKEDSAMLLPLGMKTKIVCKHNFRNLVDMSHQRLCNRAYWEYKELFNDVIHALGEYSEEWKILTQLMKPKCEVYGYCTEERSCGKVKKKEKKNINL